MATTDGTMHGHIVAVTVDTHGDELTTAATAGATILQVIDTADFDETGGWLRVGGVGGELVEYVTIDDAAATITLTTALTTAADVAARVDVWDPDTGLAGDVVVEYVADVVDDTTGDQIQATVDHTLADRLDDTVRPGIGESVVCTLDTDGVWAVTQILGKSPVIDQASQDGERIIVRDGVIESYTGLLGETPGIYDPAARIPDRPSVAIRPGATTTNPERSTMEMVAGVSGGAGTSGSLWRVFADRAEMVSGGGAASILALGNTIQIRGGNVTLQSSEPWTMVSPAIGFTPVVGDELRWRLDAAGNVTIDGSVVLGGAIVSGDRVFTFPASVRRTNGIWRVPISAIPFATPAEMTVAFNGEVRVQFTGAPTTLRLCTSFSIL